MAKKLIYVLIDLEYPDSSVGESSSTTSMFLEVEKIIEAGAAENNFNAVHILSSVNGADSIFDLEAQ